MTSFWCIWQFRCSEARIYKASQRLTEARKGDAAASEAANVLQTIKLHSFEHCPNERIPWWHQGMGFGKPDRSQAQGRQEGASKKANQTSQGMQGAQLILRGLAQDSTSSPYILQLRSTSRSANIHLGQTYHQRAAKGLRGH